MANQLASYLPLFCFIIFGAESVIIDFREHRLPNILTIRLALAVLISQVTASLLVPSFESWLPMLRTVVFLFLAFLVLYLISRSSLGMGDVKFAIPCALVIGWYAPNQWVSFLWLAFGSAAAYAVIIWMRSGINRNSFIAFGPFMYLAVVFICGMSLLSG